ncbi:MAG: hypothetical protein J2P17_00040 [Mycobacterium sp.]|nr:hypothetical protein [Mycobacterium sp.]
MLAVTEFADVDVIDGADDAGISSAAGVLAQHEAHLIRQANSDTEYSSTGGHFVRRPGGEVQPNFDTTCPKCSVGAFAPTAVTTWFSPRIGRSMVTPEFVCINLGRFRDGIGVRLYLVSQLTCRTTHPPGSTPWASAQNRRIERQRSTSAALKTHPPSDGAAHTPRNRSAMMDTESGAPHPSGAPDSLCPAGPWVPHTAAVFPVSAAPLDEVG